MIRKIDVEAKVELHELIKTKSLLNDENKIISHIIFFNIFIESFECNGGEYKYWYLTNNSV